MAETGHHGMRIYVPRARPPRNAGLPAVHIVSADPVHGVPFPDEDFEPLRLNDPQALRDLLDARSVAQSILPFIDTRAAHWRYYLFSAPAQGRGRPLESDQRLLRVLQVNEVRAGIGRISYKQYQGDRRRTKRALAGRLSRSFETAYGSASKAFWGISAEPGIAAPSVALCKSARSYVLNEDYEGFFEKGQKPNRLQRMFHSRLVGLRPRLAKHIIDCGDLETAAQRAPSSRKLEHEDRLLFFSWALMQAYFGIADDGAPDGEDEEPNDEEDPSDEYLRSMADASLKLLDRIGTPGSINKKQLKLIRERLGTALTQTDAYRPPVLVWRLKNDGRRRQVFSSLRLFAYRRLLLATSGHR